MGSRKLAWVLLLACVIALSSTGLGTAGATSPTAVVIASIPVGTAPGYDHYDAGTGETYVSNTASSNVSVINDALLRVVATVAVGVTPKGMDYDPSHGNVWVANSGGTALSIINDTSHAVIGTTSGSVTAPTRPENDPLTRTMWVTSNATAGSVAVFNVTAPYAINSTLHLRAGTNTVGIDKDLDAKAMLVSNYGSANVTVFSLTNYSKLATIPVGTQPEAITCLNPLDECFVANRGSNTVSEINDTSWTVKATITVGAGPIGVTNDTTLNEVFVTNSLAGTVSVISAETNAVVQTITVASSPHGITSYDPVRGLVFAVNQRSNNVSVIFDGSGTGGGGGAGNLATTDNAVLAFTALALVISVGVVVLSMMNSPGRRRK